MNRYAVNVVAYRFPGSSQWHPCAPRWVRVRAEAWDAAAIAAMRRLYDQEGVASALIAVSHWILRQPAFLLCDARVEVSVTSQAVEARQHGHGSKGDV